MFKKITVGFIVLLLFSAFTLPAYASNEIPTSEDNTNDKTELIKNDELEVQPMVAPIIIGIAIRALIQFGKAELASYLRDQGVKAYCNKFGKSGPKFVSDLICD